MLTRFTGVFPEFAPNMHCLGDIFIFLPDFTLLTPVALALGDVLTVSDFLAGVSNGSVKF